MNASTYPITDNWWRFNRYELRDGYIRPAPGAKLEIYDPWAAFFDVQRKHDPPYRSLLNLVNDIASLPAGEKQSYRLSKETEARLLAWCAEYGLLGILPHQALKVVLAPQGGHLIYTVDSSQIRYVRTNTSWETSTYYGDRWTKTDEAYFTTDEIEQRKELEEHLAEAYPPPSVLLQGFGRDQFRQERLTETWGLFFPDVPKKNQETYQYPEPLSEGFWRIYTEPLGSFIGCARMLRDALDYLRELKPVEDEFDETMQAFTVGSGLSTINSLVADVGMGLYISPNSSYYLRWATPSLIAAFAAMLILDLSGGRRPRRCGACGTFFFTDSYQMLYCSDKCRHTAQKRRYRKRKEEQSKTSDFE